MRHSEQAWNAVRLYVEIVDEGVGITGLSPTVTVRRTSDGDYMQADHSWSGTPANLTMTDAGGGVYVRQTSTVALDTSDGAYLATYTESTFSVLEHELITLKISGDDQRRMYSMRQENVRFIPSAWDSTSRQPTAGTLYLYPSASAYSADNVPDGTGAMAEYAVEATFANGQLQVYGSRRVF